jgi:hypothetical protein
MPGCARCCAAAGPTRSGCSRSPWSRSPCSRPYGSRSTSRRGSARPSSRRPSAASSPVALLADLALAAPSPGANAGGSAVAAALGVVERLDALPPRRLAVELVLAGASDGAALGMRAHVDARRKTQAPEGVAVLALEPCGAGDLRFWTHEGPLWRVALHPRLVALARELPGARPHAARTAGGAHAARRRRWPAIALGRLDASHIAPRVRSPQDTAEHVDPAAVQDTIAAAVKLVRALDRSLAEQR